MWVPVRYLISESQFLLLHQRIVSATPGSREYIKWIICCITHNGDPITILSDQQRQVLPRPTTKGYCTLGIRSPSFLFSSFDSYVVWGKSPNMLESLSLFVTCRVWICFPLLGSKNLWFVDIFSTRCQRKVSFLCVIYLFFSKQRKEVYLTHTFRGIRSKGCIWWQPSCRQNPKVAANPHGKEQRVHVGLILLKDTAVT